MVAIFTKIYLLWLKCINKMKTKTSNSAWKLFLEQFLELSMIMTYLNVDYTIYSLARNKKQNILMLIKSY